MESKTQIKDLVVIPTGMWGAYFAGIRLYEKYREPLQKMGVYRAPDGYDDVSIFWIQGETEEEMEKVKNKVSEFVSERIGQMYII